VSQKFVCRNSPWLLAICLLAFVHVAEAQQPGKVHRIGYLSLGSPSPNLPLREAFREGLRQVGYVEGQNIIIEYRWAESRIQRLYELAADFVRLKVDVIVATGTQANLAAKNATGTIPIVMANADDPLEGGLVKSLARPGGNVTGLSSMFRELNGKRLELLKEAFPKMRRLGVLWHTSSNPAFKGTQAAAQTLGFKIISLEVGDSEGFDSAFALLTAEHPDGLFTVNSAFMTANRKPIVGFAAKNRLPAIYSNETFVDDGGLMSYTAGLQDLHRRAAIYVDKILKGAKPADLPVEQPTKFELVINLRTANQIGLAIPANVLARADKVIK
jgi:ABC-type uncharacterized transport system substrate-binding protein